MAGLCESGNEPLGSLKANDIVTATSRLEHASRKSRAGVDTEHWGGGARHGEERRNGGILGRGREGKKPMAVQVLTCYGTKIVLQWLKEGKLVINKISQLGPMDPSTNSRLKSKSMVLQPFEGPRPTSQLLVSCPHAKAEVDDHPTRMKAYFHISGYVNKQKYWYWYDINPREIYKVPLDSVGHDFILWDYRILYFFKDDNRNAVTVNSEYYVEMLQTFVTP
ncbi:hypothetical protein ANN_21869 [Periplaneta americana]|uniref:Uncharacterized protein n=1 Tax=Periplaneta americana TaxID=6978 RepID=A0ABQ8S6V3_PERAM|nr:hypothetical protein ANN_21869 [Periplaneta americana]